MCNAIDAYKRAYSAAKYLDETGSSDGPSETNLNLCQRLIQTAMFIGQYLVKFLSIATMCLLAISTLIIESCLGLFSFRFLYWLFDESEFLKTNQGLMELKELTPDYEINRKIW